MQIQKDIRAIKRGSLRRDALLDKLLALSKLKNDTGLDEWHIHRHEQTNADNYVKQIFQWEEDKRNDYIFITRPSGMYHYQPSYVVWITDMIERLALTKDDVFYDFGSGRGFVVNLIALLTEAKAVGIEYVDEYVKESNIVKANLNINNSITYQGDVTKTDFSDGTVFYMFNPFSEAIVKNVLRRIKKIAKERKVRICAVCNDDLVEGLDWLREIPSNYKYNDYYVHIFESKY